MKRTKPILWELFLTFAKIGLFTFGGGYAMISIIEDNCVENKKWITHDDMMNITVIAESTPGPIAINCATFVGFKQAGLTGAAVATFGMVLPSFLILFAISKFLDNFLEIPLIAAAFRGIKLAVGILILDAAFRMLGKMKKKAFPVSVMAVSCLLMLVIDFASLRVSTVALMLAAAAVGLAFFFGTQNRGRKGGEKS